MRMATGEGEGKWVVIYCGKDDSHSLVPLGQVVCDEETVHIGDDVLFNLRNKMHQGIIRNIGDDYDEMNASMMELNKSKQSESFHEDRPRKGRARAQANIQAAIAQMTKKRHSRTSEQSLNGKKTSNHLPEQQKDGDTTDNVSSDESCVGSNMDGIAAKKQELHLGNDLTDEDDNKSDCSSASLTEAEKQVLKKAMAKKKRLADVKALHSFKTSSIAPGAQASFGFSELKNKASVSPNAPGHLDASAAQGIARSLSSQSSSKSANSGEQSVDEKSSDTSSAESADTTESKKRKKLRRSIPNKRRETPRSPEQFTGKMFQCCEEYEGVVKLFKTNNVYVSESALCEVKSNTSTATAMARRLIPLVFSKEGRSACSVGGAPATGRGREHISYRPALHQEGIRAILDFTTNRAKKKKWPMVSHAELRSKMAAKLCEDRAEVTRKGRTANEIEE